MKKISVFIFCLIIFCLSLMNPVFSESHYRYVRDPQTDVYFGHISYTEAQLDGKDPVVLREGRTIPEVAVLNFPIAPGDTVSTPGDRRCEIQFDTGTIVRLDTNTEVKIETILAQSLTSPSKLTNFVLLRGQIYVMYKQYSGSEILQILFSNASAKFKHKSVLLMRANSDGSTDVKVDTGEASVLFGPEEHLEKIDLKRSEEATISADNQILYSPYEGGVDFSLWNLDMNKNFLALHRGITGIPKPIQRLSPAVFNFAQKFSNLWGEWQWNEIYGYVWRPFANDQRYPSGNWQPYIYGQWRQLNGELFWIPQESWGWVPYHLGIWVWDKKTGWLWIPGGAFASSWTTWNYYSGYFSWRPINLFDLLFQGLPYYYKPGQYFDGLLAYGQTPQYGIMDNGMRAANEVQINKDVFKKINKHQLMNSSSVKKNLPNDMKKILANLVDALKNGDVQLIESMKSMPAPTAAVNGAHLSSSSLTKFMLEMDQMSAILQGGLMSRDLSVNPLDFAKKAFQHNELIVNLAQNLPGSSMTLSGVTGIRNPSIEPFVWIHGETKETIERDPSTNRFRDWNPDVKVANRMGVTIQYSSLENAVHVPELERNSGSGRVGAFNFSRSASSSSMSSGESTSSTSSTSSSSSSSASSSKESKSSSTKSTTSKTIKKY